MTTQTFKYAYGRDDVRALLFDISAEALRKLIKAKKFPAPDVNITARTQAWNRSTLVALGYELPAAEAVIASDAASGAVLAPAATQPMPSSSPS